MAQPSEVTIPIDGVMAGLTLHVRVTGLNVFRARLWAGAQLMKLAALIIGCRVDVSLDG